MVKPLCDRLDDYLCGWLSEEDVARFEVHLAGCPTCQEESAAQQQIDRLLAEATACAESVPPSLVLRIKHQAWIARRRQRFAWMCAVAAAAAVALTCVYWTTRMSLFDRYDRSQIAKSPTADNDSLPPIPNATPEPQTLASARVALIDPSSAILVPVESQSANVTVVWVYPAVRVNREGDGHLPP